MIFKNKSKKSSLNFRPELIMMSTKSPSGDPEITMRISSGDSLNKFASKKISSSYSSLSLKTEIEVDDNHNNHPEYKLKGNTYLVIETSSGVENFLLTDHLVLAPKSIEPDEAIKQIDRIWQEEFSIAQIEYLQSISGAPQSKNNKMDKIVNIICITLIVCSVLVIGATQVNKYFENQSANQTTQEIGGGTNLNHTPQSVDDEVLAEFGLEKGIELDQ